MEFSIYCDYEIIVKIEYCYLNEEGDHETGVEEFTETIDGSELAEYIAKLLHDGKFSSASVSDNLVSVSTFNPLNGTGRDIQITIKEVEDDG